MSMSQAYTPGLKRKDLCKVRKTRKLPLQGEVLVKEGDIVSAGQIVARTKLPGDPFIVEAGAMLNATPKEMIRYMIKKVGDQVQKGEIIAETGSFFGRFKRICKSPVNGTIELVSSTTGQVLIRENPIPVQVDAYVPGKVVEVLPNEGVVVETTCALIQGIFGIGGESHGELMLLTDSEDQEIIQDAVTEKCAGKVLVGGSFASTEIMKAAKAVGARGIVVGGVGSKELSDFLGYKIGVAITGQEEIGITVVVTEGFGQMSMSRKTLELLRKFEGKLCCIDGTTQIRAGVIRPEVIIPRDDMPADVQPEGTDSQRALTGLTPGTSIRLIRDPYFGAIGRVLSLPVEPQTAETESKVRVLEAELEDGRRVLVPRANVEIIEE